MKVRLQRDESFPVYGITDFESGIEVEITKEELIEYDRACELYDAAQKMLEDKWKAAGGK